jgi:hypothetical protein
MSEFLRDDTGRLICAAGFLGELVDKALNQGAIAEYEEATDALQEPGADLGEGHAYLDSGEVTFTAQSAICGICRGRAELSPEGSVTAEKCQSSGSCELEWVSRYPQSYNDEDGHPTTSGQLNCSAEIPCSARIAMLDARGQSNPTVVDGVCQIAARGKDWQKRGYADAYNSSLVKPENGIPEFDGVGSDREAREAAS